MSGAIEPVVVLCLAAGAAGRFTDKSSRVEHVAGTQFKQEVKEEKS